jgi:Beta-propeller repeat/RTX calcium-binding nonapeptide repeat (4 copies)
LSRTLRVLVLPFSLVLIGGAVYLGMPRSDGGPRSIQAAKGAFDQLAIPFVQNLGQTDPDIAFTLPGEPAVAFGSSGLDLAVDGHQVDLSFVGGREASPVGVSPADTAVSYFEGDQEDWVTDVPTYDGLQYREVWPGIDLRYGSTSGALKYEFEVAPGADPSAIRMAYQGASELELSAGGGLRVLTPGGELLDRAPVAWQPGGGPVDVVYDVDGTSYGFDLGSYDATMPLVIDPAIVHSGFIGGSGTDGGQGIAVDDEGAAYVTGYTQSADFPATSYDTILGGSRDGFVAKVRPDGTGFVYVALLGGMGINDYAERIVVDGAGNAYITGQANSNDFPTKVGPDLNFNGLDDGIIVKLNPTGTDLVFSGYIGGNHDDYTYGVALGPDGSVFVSGTTKSNNFPATVLDTTLEGLRDAFFAKVKPDGTGLAFAGLVGGNMTDRGHGIQVASDGDFYLAGQSSSTNLTGTSAFDTSHNGSDDVFLARIAGDGSAIRSLGFIGGTGSDGLNDFATDPRGNGYLVGFTRSADFPVAVGPDLTFNSSSPDSDAFVTKVDPTGMSLVYSGYVGGAIDNDVGNGIGVDPSGAAYLAGITYSSDFPAVDGPDTTYNEPGSDAMNNGDAFVAKIDPSGAGLVYSSFLGGPSYDYAYGVVPDVGGNAHVTGESQSSDFPAVVGPDTTSAAAPGQADAFVTKIETTERCQGRPVTLLGSDGKDQLKGMSGADVVLALGGNDRVSTQGGKDRVCGGKKNDTVKGGGGADRLLGEQGKDDLVGGGGKDLCKGGPGKDEGKACEKGKV